MKTHSATRPICITVLSALVSSAWVGGCTVGPDYKRPEVQTPSSFRAQFTPQEAASFADLPWWSAFNDPALQALITEALHNNYDIQIAVARIEQARAQVRVVHSEALPQVDYGADVGIGRNLVPQERSEQATIVGAVGGGINFAWEPDLWGRIRRSTEAARANLLAQEDVRRGVLLSLVTDVASGYFRLVQLDRELAISEDSTRVFKNTLDLFTLRFEGGRDSELSVQRAKANYDESRAVAAGLKRQIGQQENALSTLLGANPKDIPRGRTLLDQTMPATPVGATSDLLQRRPDILAAEQGMVAANAQIGVAIANFFPHLGLSALVGVDWLHVAEESTTFGLWNVALSAAGPIFNGGRLRAIRDQSKAYWDETVAQYRKTVLIAFQETSDALIAQQTLVARRAAQEAQVVDLQRSAELALNRYQNGRATYFEVLEAQQQLFPAQASLAQTQGDQLLATVDLYKALGGGWKLTPADWAQPAASAAAGR